MKIHEYQAKDLLRQYGVAVPECKLALTADEAYEIAKAYGGITVVKAQIHAGGRGKAGGVKVAKTPEDAKTYAQNILGMTLHTHQTGPEGQLVRKVIVERGSNIAREYYLGIVLDRDAQSVTVMASTEGGMEIEEVAAHSPEKIIKETAHPGVGLSDFQARKVAFGLGLEGDTVNKAVKFIKGLYRLFVEKDCAIAEINPLVVTKEGDVVALDAKINFDSNALYRHKDIVALRDFDEENPLEIEASKWELNYIKLDGSIGCMVNGAGLAMATMDAIKLEGAEPANFLDVGGGATKERVTAAFKIILSDPRVKAVLVNIFGGIVRCDMLAQGIVEAAREVSLNVPLVVRLEGTKVEEGKQILRDSGLPIISADGMADAAKKVVAAVR
jgi:succinyl-CoA synthetase beta subunit